MTGQEAIQICHKGTGEENSYICMRQKEQGNGVDLLMLREASVRFVDAKLASVPRESLTGSTKKGAGEQQRRWRMSDRCTWGLKLIALARLLGVAPATQANS